MVSDFLWPQCGHVSVAVITVMLVCFARARVGLPSLSRGHFPPQVLSQFGRHGLPVPPNPGYEIGWRRGLAVMTGAPRDELEHRGQEIESLLGQPVRRAPPGPPSPDQAQGLQPLEP